MMSGALRAFAVGTLPVMEPANKPVRGGNVGYKTCQFFPCPVAAEGSHCFGLLHVQVQKNKVAGFRNLGCGVLEKCPSVCPAIRIATNAKLLCVDATWKRLTFHSSVVATVTCAPRALFLGLSRPTS